ncbi:MAG: ClpXP protease specificity-enhancing factor [Gammaproteobacteria bacterium]
MTPNKPYLIRAFYEWITDNGLTPYLLVRTQTPGCQVPLEHVKNGEIVFNIASHVVHQMLLGNDYIEFKARFGGISRQIYVPIAAVGAIYAKENGSGIPFPPEEVSASEGSQPQDASAEQQTSKPKGKPELKIVK